MEQPAAIVCPICRKPADPRLRPFCSARCADIDLGRWFTEGYAVPAEAKLHDGMSAPDRLDDQTP